MIQVLSIEEFLSMQASLPVVDARSEDEFKSGHLPGSINIPILNNEHRKIIGTLYKQSGKEAAIMKGFQLVGPEFYQIFKQVRKMAVDHRIAMYCWRGGLRSNIMAWMMNLADYEITLIKGGYKAWRGYAHQLFGLPWQWVVVSGATGTGKTAILQSLAQQGEQVLDLEALANHKGSAFGHIGMPPQPRVEHFENLIATRLLQFDINRPVWVENESRFIGSVRIPDVLFSGMMNMPVVELKADLEYRKQRIMQEYGIMPVDALLEATQKLEKKLGGDRMREACRHLTEDNHSAWLDILLHYYDKTYAFSNQQRKGKSVVVELSNENITGITTQILEQTNLLWNQKLPNPA